MKEQETAIPGSSASRQLSRVEINTILGEPRRCRIGLSDNRMVEIAYGDLKRIGQKLLRSEYRYNRLQTQALIHEAYLRFIKLEKIQWQNARHYFSVWKLIMRRVLIDQARFADCEKRGGFVETSPLTDCIAADQEPDKQDLYDALEKLKAHNKTLYQLIHLNYFKGLTIEEIASNVGKSTATVKRRLHAARQWLGRALSH